MENYKPTPTPMAVGVLEFMVLYKGQATKAEIKLYRSKVGSEIYIAVQTRVDIVYTVSILLRFLANPSL